MPVPKPPVRLPPDSDIGDDFATLDQLLGNLNVAAADIDVALGTDSGQTRRQVAESLILWLRDRPKADL